MNSSLTRRGFGDARLDLARRDLQQAKSAGRHRRHFRGTAPLAAELHPWLRAVTKDLARGLDPARVIKRTGHYHRDIRHDLRLVDERRSAYWAEASVSRFAAVTPASECLQCALYRKCPALTVQGTLQTFAGRG